MNQISVYTELSSLFDDKRAVLETMLPAGETWDGVFKTSYENRRIDIFEKPELGIYNDKYKELYSKRDILLFRNIRPTPLINRILTLVLDAEKLIGKPIAASKINITINLYPYVLDDELKGNLYNDIKSILPYNNSIDFVNRSPAQLTSSYLRNFSNVFKYDLLIGEDSKAFMESLPKTPMMNTRCFVPDLYVKEPESGIVSEPEEIIQRFSILTATVITLLPVNHAIYDYTE